MSSINQYWWKNQTAYIIGGGSSLPSQFDIPTDIIQAVRTKELPLSAYSPYMQLLHDKNVIGINAAYLLGPWMDIIFFHDEEFWQAHKEGLENYPGQLITCNSRFSNRPHPKVNYLPKDRTKCYGINKNPNLVCWNHNSGAAAISVAANMGATKIILLGFDMNAPAGISHMHSEYNQKHLPPFAKHLLGFEQISKDAETRGIKIINCSLESAITQFPKMNLEDAINER